MFGKSNERVSYRKALHRWFSKIKQFELRRSRGCTIGASFSGRICKARAYEWRPFHGQTLWVSAHRAGKLSPSPPCYHAIHVRHVEGDVIMCATEPSLHVHLCSWTEAFPLANSASTSTEQESWLLHHSLTMPYMLGMFREMRLDVQLSYPFTFIYVHEWRLSRWWALWVTASSREICCFHHFLATLYVLNELRERERERQR